MALIIPFDGTSPTVDPSAFVAPTATLIGAVTLAANSSVLFGAVLRADRAEIRIGAGSNLQDNVVVHGDPNTPTIVGAGVSVGHATVLHGCLIEDGCLVGMNATVLNRAVVGRQSLVAAGSVVLEDSIIPPRSLVAGVPAKVRRSLTDEEVEGLRQNAVTYVELGAAYRAALG
ncbi:carbonic anhydrase/acetyltransferase-like protein (isoleucine patch superfamily) [Glaciihabitans tibetensis]|uniref:Carbonic anhydrase/acetyltransferase-like protein (Isoleucine patch superfamily) n=1 Tax=Glaciihabitans tibetensis TaxID=1266600 RepID=A0A2T0VI60_9MICO|nr:gamma carbonic anhydrase family protein [Glaciihabitans tibetensis]PRY69926.1 carbonic anhydrase/acetyltransferase-like protein (isoleucine patch superfamily) [Glaciihabitans tibetensis]